MTRLVAVCCIDCGVGIQVTKENEAQELAEIGWERAGGGWRCPHCVFRRDTEHEYEISRRII